MTWELLVSLITGVAGGALLARFFTPPVEQTEAFKQASAAAEERLKALEAAALAEHKERERELTQAARKVEDERKELLKRREGKLAERERSLEQRDQEMSRRDRDLSRREKEQLRRDKQLEAQEAKMQEDLAAAERELETRASLTREEARAQLVSQIEERAKRESVERIRKVEEAARELAEEEARKLICQAVQRYAGEHVAEHSTVAVPIREDQTGKIIGREGRNIRAFSQLSGCDVLIDEMPGSVIISCFNPIRREVAKRTLERLLLDGRINIARIEDALRRSEAELDQLTRQYGESAALELELSGLHPELLRLLGRLHYTTSFAQNVLQHSVEVGAIAGMLAAELGLNAKLARRAGLLHDIGKAADQLVEGDHAEAGAALCKKYGEPPVVVAAVGAHHDEEGQDSVLSQVVAAANALSASRPGARRPALAAQIKRLEELEELVCELEAVERCYAFKAGAELRVVVDNAKVDDPGATLLAREIAKKIEEEMSITQDVRVVVIRPTRVVSYAR
jgi:ribonuclease Y